MGDAPGMRLTDLQREICRRLGYKAKGMSTGVAEVVITTLRFWPERAMVDYASQSQSRGLQVLDAMAVIWAKVREDLEARWGTDATTQAAIDKLVQPVVTELASIWFSSPESRVAMRGCIVEAIRQKT